MKVQSPKYAGTVIHDTANAASSGVLRDTDNSINVGQANVVNLDNSGGVSLQPKNFTGTGTLDFTASLITVDATSAGFALTLPAVAASPGFTYWIFKKDNAHNVTLTGNGAENIQTPFSTANTFVMGTQGQMTCIWTDGVQWYADVAGVPPKPRNITGTATLDRTSLLNTVDATSGAFALTLPAVASSNGVTYYIFKKDNAHNVTLTGNASENIQTTASTANTYVMSTQGQMVILFCDGTQWYAKI